MTTLHETAERILAHHREAGTPEAERARAAVADHLTSLGYTVSLQRFRFHPSALLGMPILGAGIGAAALLALPLLTLPAVPAAGALAVWAIMLLATICLAVGVGAGWLTFGEAREDANLVAVRPQAAVRRWIVAHLDTKAQAQSMAGRLVAIWTLAAAITVTGAVAVARLWGPIPPALGTAGVALAVLAGALAGRGRLRGTSRGARDNGSGVIAALAFAEASADEGSGVLITGQSASQRTPISVISPSDRGMASKAPGISSRRMTARATSISGEMMASIGMWDRVNSSVQIG